jgi:hypothetical protein
MEYENLSKIVLLDNAILTPLMCGRKYGTQNGVCSRESNVVHWFFETKSVIKKVFTELNMKKIHLQIMLSDVG